ncbi:hypothetical protein HOP52_01190 [Halomonas campisalis]|uniref:GGDEF domain-containing protein n=1 Tax=Billgrantia campisalis TaxID=74661 RepID=A0ABS9P3M9_9GAMM|nr:hypothetical protein [Halomonas campisalis]MCG6656393.1 hypothetical protein [Halomonas campisalis]MDR5861579.1 hypothetical protein [Halomonas campisalis]
MQSKYKVGRMRLNLLAAALLLAILAYRSELASSALLLWLAVAWLTVTAALLEFSHRRPASLPWQLLPSLLLASLLWTDPHRHALWIWVWPALLMLPQPGWMLGLSVALAGLTWWSLYDLWGFEQALLSGLVLLTLMLLGMAHNREFQPLRLAARQRARLIPGLALWSAQQLSADLQRERARCQREGVHGELLLLRTPRHLLWSSAQELCRQTHDFENCYRLDHHTLAALLLSRDREQAAGRRQALLERLRAPAKARFVSLNAVGRLDEQLHRLEHQSRSLDIEPPNDTEIGHGGG